MAIFAFIALFVLVFIAIALLRSFWDWRAHPKIPVAAILVNAYELLGLKNRKPEDG
jgi:hypothetical protein